jgi:hypothetical protein
MVATDTFVLLEVAAREDCKELKKAPKEDNKRLPFYRIPKKGILVNAQELLKKQSFESNQLIEELEDGFLLKGRGNKEVRIRTTDLNTTTDVYYMLNDGKFPEYEQIFPKNADFIAGFDPRKIVQVLNELIKMKVTNVGFFIENNDEHTPLMISGEGVRALVMPMSADEEDYKPKKKKRGSVKKDSQKG